ncbi:MAG: hypothetical protein MJ244_06535 [Clostridia bacterium]|nr:hypothetical protein [Clostridia bacterium]
MENKVRVFDDLIKIERHKPIFAGGYHDWEIQYNTLNYEKAIEVMAKAFCEIGAPNTWDLVEENYKSFCLAAAKKALNDILKGDKNESKN